MRSLKTSLPFAVISSPPVDVWQASDMRKISRGRLAECNIIVLMQAISMAALTGTLQIESALGLAELYFVRGVCIYARTTSTHGDKALIELIADWDHGRYQFRFGRTQPKCNLTCSAVSLISQGSNIRDKTSALLKAGWRPCSILVRAENAPPVYRRRYSDLVEWIAGDTSLQQQFCSAIDGKSTAEQIAARLGLSKAEWIPMLAGLLLSNQVAALPEKQTMKSA
jgi:hypothetical protein